LTTSCPKEGGAVVAIKLAGSTESKDEPLRMATAIQVNSSGILVEFYRDSTGAGGHL